MLLLIAACQRGPATSPRVARTPTPLDTAATGAIAGHVRLSGVPPGPRDVAQLGSDPTCAAAHPGGLGVGAVRAENGLVADAMVYVARGLEDRVFAVPDAPVDVDQRGCLFAPPVVGVRAGQRLEFVNSDDTLHNVHGAPTASPAWNFGLGVRGARRSIVIEQPEVPVPVRCDVHPWMRADVGVFDHPYFTVTGTDGAFRLAGVPAGHYILGVWHPVLGRSQQEVDVAASATSDVDVRYDAVDGAGGK